VRTFIAVELEPSLRRPLVKLLREVVPSDREVRWCSEQQLHITLKFLGEVRDAQLAQVCNAVAQAAAQVPPFNLRIKGLGCFPAARNPRVLWCGVEDLTAGCRRWVELADPLLAALGFPPEGRAFTPHITLGRSRSTAGGRVFQQVLETVSPPETQEMTVSQVVVFESRLLPGGAEYKSLATVPLGGS
jgi:RNA 2',3'-cyclic 3'-phosphodiesterase